MFSSRSEVSMSNAATNAAKPTNTKQRVPYLARQGLTPSPNHASTHGEQVDVSPLTTPIHHPPPILAKRAQALRSIKS